MEAKIINRDDSHVLGIHAVINPMAADYQELWGKQFNARQADIDPLASESGYYSAYFGTGVEGQVDFVAGVMVDADAIVPEGLVKRPVPGGEYAAFECGMSEISGTWGRIYGEWMPSSGYVEDETRPSLEFYAGASEDAAATILVAISAATATH